MAKFYEMPAVSPTMEFGTLVQWRVKEGQAFASGTVLAEVGTDKANMDAEIFDEGVLIKHLAKEGDEIPPGRPIAIWGSRADEDISSLLASLAAAPAPAAPAPAAPAAPAPAASAPAPAAPAPAPAPVAAAPAAPPPSERPAAPEPNLARTWMGRTIHQDFFDPPGDAGLGRQVGRVAATPLARKLAEQKGIALASVQGTGPNGRIVVADVEQAASRPAPMVTSAPAAPASTPVRHTPMRKTIARRLLASHQDIPTFFLTTTLDASAMVALRETVKVELPGVKVSYNDILLKAVARSLAEHPQVNASWTDDAVVQHGRVDLGVAVALEGGLITPVIRRADRLGLAELSKTVADLAARAREQKLKPEEYTGGTFTISNLGMMGIDHFTAIINPPEAAILAVGRMVHEPVVVDGEIKVRPRIKVTLTCDHRVIDGAVGAAFLQTVRRYVENPLLLLV